jgi:hypothetical protein
MIDRINDALIAIDFELPDEDKEAFYIYAMLALFGVEVEKIDDVPVVKRKYFKFLTGLIREIV